ncbi:MAG: hypothetical protein JST68_26560 [Bacteroidetes bacterium]|nr:hypothetical protein [Bacteroidota bacterium]
MPPAQIVFIFELDSLQLVGTMVGGRRRRLRNNPRFADPETLENPAPEDESRSTNRRLAPVKER